MNTTLIVVACIWLVSFVIFRGFTFALFQREFPLIAGDKYERDKTLTFILCLLPGPMNFLVVPLALGRFWRHGWFWPSKYAKNEAMRLQREAKGEIVQRVILADMDVKG